MCKISQLAVAVVHCMYATTNQRMRVVSDPLCTEHK